MRKNNRIMNWNNVVELFREYNVFDEQELNEKLVRESQHIPCVYCCREFPVDKLVFLDGDPYCPRCRNAR